MASELARLKITIGSTFETRMIYSPSIDVE
jgi:hypothetical protein